MRLVIESDRPSPSKADPTLLKEIGRAYRCFEALLAGKASIAELVAREGVDDRYVSCVLPLAFLSPEIVEAVVKGIQPADLTATKLVRRIDLGACPSNDYDPRILNHHCAPKVRRAIKPSVREGADPLDKTDSMLSRPRKRHVT